MLTSVHNFYYVLFNRALRYLARALRSEKFVRLFWRKRLQARSALLFIARSGDPLLSRSHAASRLTKLFGALYVEAPPEWCEQILGLLRSPDLARASRPSVSYV
jgi:hypothetical protein